MRFLFSATLLMTIVLITACSKETSLETDNPYNPNNPQQPSPGGVTGDMKGKIGGVQWVANKAAGAARMQGLINITGMSTDRKIITITLTDSGVHRYILSDMTINAAALIDSSEANPMTYTTNQGTYPTDAGGEVKITAIDAQKQTISGTFFFKLFREMDGARKTVTEGSFTNLKYTTVMPPSAASDTFRVKIAGASWAPASVTGLSVPIMNQIAVNATSATASKTVGLVFPNNIAPGSYTLDFFGLTYIGQYNPDSNPANSKVSTSGTLTILEHNTSTKRIRGNFQFIAEEMTNPQNFVNITDGYFSVRYQ
jgi:hypothetical protein